jgi:pimeloyl-ACP methyl ester carboxylesterase
MSNGRPGRLDQHDVMRTRTLRRLTALPVVAVLVALLGAAVPASARTGSAGHSGPRLVDPAPCVEAAGFTCSYLTVPLDRGGTVPGRLRLRVGVSDNATAPRGVLLLLTGGPGQPGPGLLGRVAARFAAYASEYRLVMIDQRGTGEGAIDCPGLQAEVGSSDVLTPSPQAVRDCAALLGRTRHFYTTGDTVADLEDLRRALGVSAWTMDGISYGTFVAGQYGLTYPHRVRRIVMDSVVPQYGVPALYVDSLDAVDRVLRKACEEQSCGFDPAQVVADVLRDGVVDPVDLWNWLIIASIVDPKLTGETYYPVLLFLELAAAGEVEPLQSGVAEQATGEGTPIDQYSSGLHIATICPDLFQPPWGSSAAPLAGRDRAIRRALSRVDPDDTWPFEPRATVDQAFVSGCRYWPRSRPNPEPPRRRLTMPVLILNGDRDLSTPVKWAHDQAAITPRGQLVVIEGMGHSIQGRNAAGDAAVREFLLD